MLLLFDNYDSFTYNLKDYLEQCHASVKVVRNDEVTLGDIIAMNPAGIVISPGPGKPADAGILPELVACFADKKPVLGICLGFQAIGEYYGAVLCKAPLPMHGKVSRIGHSGEAMFANITGNIDVCRYHSLMLQGLENTPLKITACTDDGVPMAFVHEHLPVWGMQYHPEAILTTHGLQMIANWVNKYCLD